MEKPIRLEETEDTPKVVLDRSGHIFEISGKSMPEDAFKFYDPIQKWIEEYAKNPNDSTELHIKLEYFNSKSLKQILRILIKLELIAKAGKHIRVIWFYDNEDELMQIKGEEIKSIIRIPFDFIAY